MFSNGGKFMALALTRFLTASGLALVLSACAQVPTEPAPKKAKPNNDDLYEVMHEGRRYVFDDFAVFQDFLAQGETPYRKTIIGGGPNGETLVYGLRSKDKKKLTGIAAVDLYRIALAPAPDFYGEMRLEDGRIYVFSGLGDMLSVRQTGEAPYRWTEIGTGPKGETVVFVLNKGNKKKKPQALIDAFNKKYSL